MEGTIRVADTSALKGKVDGRRCTSGIGRARTCSVGSPMGMVGMVGAPPGGSEMAFGELVGLTGCGISIDPSRWRILPLLDRNDERRNCVRGGSHQAIGIFGDAWKRAITKAGVIRCDEIIIIPRTLRYICEEVGKPCSKTTACFEGSPASR